MFTWNLQPGDQINLFAQKKNIYELKGEKIVEATGNLVIIHNENTIYGDYAKFNFTRGEFFLEGNVRYIAKGMTLYGSKIDYNLKTKNFIIYNSKIFAPTFSIVAKSVSRIKADEYIAEEAEFSTCLDCPESWSIYGRNINVTTNEYVSAKHALLKIKGTDFLYIPRIIFPIKNNRQTGLLFPHFSARLKEGFVFEQPVFVAISPYQDATLVPSFWTKRGYGLDVQYRWNWSNSSWLRFDSIFLNDRIYIPNKEKIYLTNDELEAPSGKKFFRSYEQIDFAYIPSNDSRFRFYWNGMRDLDMGRDFSRKIYQKTFAPSTGLFTFANKRLENVELISEAHLQNSVLVNDEIKHSDPFTLDQNMIQLLPRVTAKSKPFIFKLFGDEARFLPQLIASNKLDYSIMKPMNGATSYAYRDTKRLELSPTIQVPWWRGDYFQLSSELSYEIKNYHLKEQEILTPPEGVSTEYRSSFKHQSLLLNNKWSFTLEKIFGIAYWDEVPIIRTLSLPNGDIDLSVDNNKNQLIGNLLPIEQAKGAIASDVERIPHYAYKHQQEIAILHHYLLKESYRGNEIFAEQLKTSSGWFDRQDAFWSYDYQGALASEDFISRIDAVNTVELQWNHDIIRKSPGSVDYRRDYSYINDQFSFSRVAYLKFSQGFKIDKYNGDNHFTQINKVEQEKATFKDSLTRLSTTLGINYSDAFNWSLTHTYYHDTTKSVINTRLVNRFDSFILKNDLKYNENNQRKFHMISSSWIVNDELSLLFSNQRDLETNINMSQTYGFKWNSLSKCWLFGLSYTELLTDQQVSFDFAFNFGPTQGMQNLGSALDEY